MIYFKRNNDYWFLTEVTSGQKESSVAGLRGKFILWLKKNNAFYVVLTKLIKTCFKTEKLLNTWIDLGTSAFSRYDKMSIIELNRKEKWVQNLSESECG